MLAARAVLLPVLLVLATSAAAHAQGDYTGAQDDASAAVKYTIHLIPHSHCDAGWLKTVDEYFNANVTHILTNVVTELVKQPSRRFNWAESVYFSMWWAKQDQRVRRQVMQLVRNGQLEFIGGGWVQSTMDVASPWATVNQLTLGHTYLKQELGVRPTRAWKIDPFGADSLTSSLMYAANISSIVINRMDYRIQEMFNRTQGYQFHWQPAPTKRAATKMLTHALDEHYDAPVGFDWESSSSPVLNETVVITRAAVFQDDMLERARRMRTRHVLVPFGTDFRFQNASRQFDNMDILVNAGTHFVIEMQYSTLSTYFQAVEHAAKTQAVAFPTVDHDFFPYCSCWGIDADRTGDCEGFWVGHYSTLPWLKAMSRHHDALLRAAEAFYVIGRARFPHVDWRRAAAMLQIGREAQGVMQHHDAITGTAKNLVNKDYRLRMQRGIDGCNYVLQHVLASFLFASKPEHAQHQHLLPLAPHATVLPVSASDAPAQHIVLVNSLGFRRLDPAHVHVLTDMAQVEVFDGTRFVEIPSQVTEVVAGRPGFLLSFISDLPPLGWRVYRVSGGVGDVGRRAARQAPRRGVRFQAMNDVLRVSMTYDVVAAVKEHADGPSVVMDVQIQRRDNTATTHVRHRLAKYDGWWGGKYVMRSRAPASLKLPVECSEPYAVHQAGAVMTQIDVVCADWSVLQYRVYQCPYSERECHKDAGLWHSLLSVFEQSTTVRTERDSEVVSEYQLDYRTDDRFFTDNGMELIPRRRITSGPRSSKPEASYFPVLSQAAVQEHQDSNTADAETQRMLTLMLPHATGGSSQASGQLEIVLQRRTAHDDARGVDEMLDDQTKQSLRTWVLASTAAHSERVRHRLALQQQFPAIGYLIAQRGDNNDGDDAAPSLDHVMWQALQSDLPQGSHLFSLHAPYYNDTTTVRVASTRSIMSPSSSTADSATEARVTVPLDSLWGGTDPALPRMKQCASRSLTLMYDLPTDPETRKCAPVLDRMDLLTFDTVLGH